MWILIIQKIKVWLPVLDSNTSVETHYAASLYLYPFYLSFNNLLNQVTLWQWHKLRDLALQSWWTYQLFQIHFLPHSDAGFELR